MQSSNFSNYSKIEVMWHKKPPVGSSTEISCTSHSGGTGCITSDSGEPTTSSNRWTLFGIRACGAFTQTGADGRLLRTAQVFATVKTYGQHLDQLIISGSQVG